IITINLGLSPRGLGILKGNVPAIMTQKHKIDYNPNIEVEEKWIVAVGIPMDEDRPVGCLNEGQRRRKVVGVKERED
ncbi:26005_t:CDS:2, partial [Gigaspora rosea]